jgi:regulatory protein
VKPAVLSPDRLQHVALRYLTGRDCTEAQLKAYLLRKGASPETLQPLFERFQGLGYLNDETYALRWAQSRLRGKPMGRARLEMELQARGVPRPVARRVLDGLYAEHDELDLARRLLAHRRPALRRGIGRKDESDARRRIRQQTQTAGLLQRHGFRHEVIRTILRESVRKFESS